MAKQGLFIGVWLAAAGLLSSAVLGASQLRLESPCGWVEIPEALEAGQAICMGVCGKGASRQRCEALDAAVPSAEHPMSEISFLSLYLGDRAAPSDVVTHLAKLTGWEIRFHGPLLEKGILPQAMRGSWQRAEGGWLRPLDDQAIQVLIDSSRHSLLFVAVQ